MDDQFKSLEKILSNDQRRHKDLVVFLEVLKKENFDEEDIQLVQNNINLMSMEIQKRATQLAARRRIYDNEIKVVKDQIHKRQVVLETQMKTLSAFPQIMTFFAEKQSSLQDTIDGIFEKLKT